MPTHATALFADRHAAHAAVEQLVQAGFPRDAISIMMLESTHEREFGSAAAEASEASGLRSTRPAGVLATIVSGLVEVSHAGGPTLRGAGPLAGALLRAAPDAVPEDAFPAALASAGLAEHEAHFLHQGVRNGSIAVGVHATGDRVRLATQLLELAGGAALQAA
jgi:hypothetical protein